MRRLADAARILLAAIRLANGGVSLVAPDVFSRRLGVEREAGAASSYALRLFGFRTVLIGLDLLHRDPTIRARALRVAPLIHLSDASAAAIAGAQRRLPRKAAQTAILVSSLNVGLSLLARRSKPVEE